MIKNIITRKEFGQILADNGIGAGMIIEAYIQLDKCDYVIGGAKTIIEEIMNAIGYTGTMVMNIKSATNYEPSYWKNLGQNLDMAKVIRKDMPIYSKKESDSYWQSDVTNHFKSYDGVIFSNHPANAFVAWGKYAKFLCNRQSIHFALSEESCCARLYELRASTLLIGCDYSEVASLNLAQYRSDTSPIMLNGSVIENAGSRTWKKYLDLNLDCVKLNDVGKILESKKHSKIFYVGQTKCCLYRCDLGVDIALKYFETNSLLSKYK